MSHNGSLPDASRRAAVRSRSAVASQSRTSSHLASSIENLSPLKNLALQRRIYVAESLDSRTCSHKNVNRHPKPADAAVRPMHLFDRTLVAVGNDHEQIDVAIGVWLAPGVRAK